MGRMVNRFVFRFSNEVERSPAARFEAAAAFGRVICGRSALRVSKSGQPAAVGHRILG